MKDTVQKHIGQIVFNRILLGIQASQCDTAGGAGKHTRAEFHTKIIDKLLRGVLTKPSLFQILLVITQIFYSLKSNLNMIYYIYDLLQSKLSFVLETLQKMLYTYRER